MASWVPRKDESLLLPPSVQGTRQPSGNRPHGWLGQSLQGQREQDIFATENLQSGT